MQSDLFHAQASVDWAVAQFPAFQARLDAWLNANVHASIKELPPGVPNNLIVAAEKEPLPLVFQVEAGAYINAIRSSLDILAATLAQRHCPTLVDDAYFPVVASAEIFAARRYKGHKFIKALPSTERLIIETLKPYKGGNELLYALHLLDIVRKHQRLLSVQIHPAKFSIMGWGMGQHFEPLSIPWLRSGNDETVLGLLAKGAPQPQMKLAMQVALDETTYLPGMNIIRALNEFATLANSIIRKFEPA
jgi:hypothetical protein